MEFTTQPLSTQMTFRPAFCASMAHASPVGPAPMTITSDRMSGRDSSCGFGKVSGICLVVGKSVFPKNVKVEVNCRREFPILACSSNPFGSDSVATEVYRTRCTIFPYAGSRPRLRLRQKYHCYLWVRPPARQLHQAAGRERA